jgi:hypothetical protein
VLAELDPSSRLDYHLGARLLFVGAGDLSPVRRPRETIRLSSARAVEVLDVVELDK